MRRINTLSELRAEQVRLKTRRRFLEAEIKKEFRELKESMEPMNIIGSSAKKSLASENSSLLSSSVGNLANFLVKVTLKRSGIIPRLVVPFLVRNVASGLVEKNKAKVVSWLGGLVTRFAEKRTLTRQTFPGNNA
jgi:hypothetical protein